MSATGERPDTSDERRSKPPIFIRMADEGTVRGRPSNGALLFILAAMLIGLVAVYIANAESLRWPQ
jgi:hypothetical protein